MLRLCLLAATAALAFANRFPRHTVDGSNLDCKAGDVWVENKIKFECYVENGVVMGVNPVSCMPSNALDGPEYQPGQEWTSGSFKYRCQFSDDSLTLSLDVIACVAPNGAEIPIGGSVGIPKKGLYRCVKTSNGLVTRKYEPGCVTSSGFKRPGQSWINGDSSVTCYQDKLNYEAKATACKANDAWVDVDSYVVVDSNYFKCISDSNDKSKGVLVQVEESEYFDWFNANGGDEEVSESGSAGSGNQKTTVTEPPPVTLPQLPETQNPHDETPTTTASDQSQAENTEAAQTEQDSEKPHQAEPDPTPAPVQPETHAPEQEPTPAPAEPETHAPEPEPTPAPVEPETHAPEPEPTPAPAEPETHAPEPEPTPAPAEPETHAPEPEPTPAPAEPETHAPEPEPTPAPVEPETNAPEPLSTPAPQQPETHAPEKPEAGKPVAVITQAPANATVPSKPAEPSTCVDSDPSCSLLCSSVCKVSDQTEEPIGMALRKRDVAYVSWREYNMAYFTSKEKGGKGHAGPHHGTGQCKELGGAAYAILEVLCPKSCGSCKNARDAPSIIQHYLDASCKVKAGLH